MTRSAALPFAAALLAISGFLTGCTEEREPYDATFVPGPYDAPRGAILSTPVAEGDETDYLALRTLLDNIVHTPPGATIRIVAFSLTLHPVADALIAADERGVHVEVVADGRTNSTDNAPPRLVEALGTDRLEDSFIVLTRGSARGGRTHQHQKTWMFSQTGASRWVTMVGSMNLSYYSTGQYNDVYSFVGRRDVYEAFGRVFRRQARDRPVADPALSVRLGTDRAWFFPGFDLDNDPTLRLLRRLPDAGTRLRFVQSAWSGDRGLAIARLLAEKVAGGAEAEVVVGFAFGPQVETVLREGGVAVHRGVFDDGSDVHDKLILAAYDGVDGQRHQVISVGSHNLGDGPYERDDVAVDIDADRGPAFAAYDEFVDALIARAESEDG